MHGKKLGINWKSMIYDLLVYSLSFPFDNTHSPKRLDNPPFLQPLVNPLDLYRRGGEGAVLFAHI